MRDDLLIRRSMGSCAVAAVRALGLLLLLIAGPSAAQDAAGSSCPGDNGGITLPPGFCATVFADNVGHARQMVAASNGVLYVNTWSGRYYRNDKPPAGGFLIALKDTTGNGRADVVVRFGPGTESGNAGGTGIALYNGALYAETNDRYDANRTGQRFSPAERFATGLRNGEGIVFDSAGRIFATMHGRDQLREN
jgi:hypothetical protein